jgi:hypothetical protein
MPYRISKHFFAWSTPPETCNAIPETEIFLFRNEKLGLRLVHATGNGTRIIPVPVQPAYNAWNSLAIR